MHTLWAAQEYSQQSFGSFNPQAGKQFACQTVLRSSYRLICSTTTCACSGEKRQPRYLALLRYWSWCSVDRFCGWDLGRHVVALYFQRHRSETQLNRGQPRVWMPVSSKHLWCPKSVQEETVGHENKAAGAAVPFPRPTSHFLALWDTRSLICISTAQLAPIFLVYLWPRFVAPFKRNIYAPCSLRDQRVFLRTLAAQR